MNVKDIVLHNMTSQCSVAGSSRIWTFEKGHCGTIGNCWSHIAAQYKTVGEPSRKQYHDGCSGKIRVASGSKSVENSTDE